MANNSVQVMLELKELKNQLGKIEEIDARSHQFILSILIKFELNPELTLTETEQTRIGVLFYMYCSRVN